MLTDLEAVFRSLKSELGLGPVFHHQQDRCDGHLFVTVLADQLLQITRRPLAAHGIHDCCNTLRSPMQGHGRITDSFRQIFCNQLNLLDF